LNGPANAGNIEHGPDEAFSVKIGREVLDVTEGGSLSSLDLKQLARQQFEKSSKFYGSTLAQRFFCRGPNALLVQLLRSRDPVRILDVACGGGQFLAELKQTFPRIELYGLDLALAMLRDAQGSVTGGSASLIQADSQCLPLLSDYFDVVLCKHSFHHFPNQQSVVREIYRVLRPGGIAMILDGDRDNAFGWLFYDVLIRWAEGPVRHVSAIAMRDLFCSAGFAKIRQYRRCFLFPMLLTSGIADKPEKADRTSFAR
jgi:SAM-dependent methyltransferase